MTTATSIFMPTLRMAVILLLVVALPIKAQALSPTQWYRINTPYKHLIFRGNMSQEAQRVANTLVHLYEPVSQSLGSPPPLISVSLWDQKFAANGGFELLPRKIEFWNGPPQNYNLLGTNDWFNLLAVHEFRHNAQHAKLKRNFNRWCYWIGGEMALGSITGMLIPAWFFEGDAVGIETALTKSGRGRIPYFSVLYKANLLERGGFSYCKQIFHSLKHQIPNHYRVGYYLTTHLRRQYGPDVLDNILENATWPMLFPIAIKKATGRSLLQIYKDTNRELKDLWEKQLQGLKLTPATSMMARGDKIYTDYSYPQLDEKGNIIVLKSGLGTADQFVLLDEHQQERPLFVPGKIHEGVSFSIAQDQIVWTEAIPHPRWTESHQYGIIQRYDIQKKRLKTLTRRSRYGTAALSPDASKIVAVESDAKYRHRLVILDADDGKVLHRLPNPENYFYMTPRWLANGRQVVAVKHYQQKATLTLVDVHTGKSQDLLPYSEENIGAPIPYGQYVFYNSAYNGIDNIYALDLASKKRYQVTSRKYGAYNPTISADGRWIIFNDFTKDGMDVAKMPLAPQEWIPLEKVEDRSIRYYAPLVAQENNGDVLEDIPHKTYPVAPYHPGKHFLNIHSWSWPILPEDNLAKIIDQLGFLLKSENYLKTTELEGGYRYNMKNHVGTIFAQLTYKGWYPVVTFDGYLIKNYKQKGVEKIAALTLSLPLEFRQGQYTNEASLSTEGRLIHNAQGSKFTQIYKGEVSRKAKKSLRDFYPSWQQKLTVSYTHTPYQKMKMRGDYEQKMEVQTEFRFPGLFKHHSLALSPQYERRTITHKMDDILKGLPLFRSVLPVSSPWQLLRRLRINTYKVKATYEWPIAYPDWSLGDLLYVKQLRGDLFYEPKYLPEGKIKYQYEVGLGATMDVGFSFLSTPFRVGAKVAYDPEVYKQTKKPAFTPSFLLLFNPLKKYPE